MAIRMPNMPTIRVSKKFTVNMGNYESYSPEFSVELQAKSNGIADIKEAFSTAHAYVDQAAYKDLEEAARVSDVRNTYILTWLSSRKELADA
jgi:hypothetical protein